MPLSAFPSASYVIILRKFLSIGSIRGKKECILSTTSLVTLLSLLGWISIQCTRSKRKNADIYVQENVIGAGVRE